MATPATDYAAIFGASFAALGIRVADRFVVGIDFLPASITPLAPPRNSVAHLVCAQLLAYLDDPDFRFDLPLKLCGSAHQIRVWEAMRAIPRGAAMSYGSLARKLGSSARAVGQACGRNPAPIVVPCHRVVAADGRLGGFMGGRADTSLAIKRWLLAHEGYPVEPGKPI